MKIYTTGKSAFGHMWAAIDNAKHYVFLESYILGLDKVGRKTVDHLTKAAERGCDVVLLYDHFGVGFDLFGTMNRLLRPLRESGGHCIEFNPLWNFPSTKSIWFRNHRKILVIDDEIGFLGGMNYSQQWVDGSFRDTHVSVYDDSIIALKSTFFDSVLESQIVDSALWEHHRWQELFEIHRTKGLKKVKRPWTWTRFNLLKLRSKFLKAKGIPEPPDWPDLKHLHPWRTLNLPKKLEPNSEPELHQPTNYPFLSPSHTTHEKHTQHTQGLPIPQIDTVPHPSSNISQTLDFNFSNSLILTGLRPLSDEDPLSQDFCNHSLYITTPYFSPPDRMKNAILLAAQRGVDVKIIVAGNLDVPIFKYVAEYFYPEFLGAGIQIYEYRGASNLHSKTILVDGKTSLVGSWNFDRYSQRNLEVILNTTEQETFDKLKETFETDLTHSKQITLQDSLNRPITTKILSWIIVQIYFLFSWF